ncbi:hypothetical protein OS188_02880 [Xanthomarina sp. F1114]|uniref:laminin B domain-containing protein n=1 Tax=Xanthomarina sp. F1114 TaxID=2996019 RepID=UPI00225DF9EC|nr:laminin B domain-containing protein [Xanthomarina sp. F1114]MCX7546891.1 hypothetical protein [Xanthomarina sp. F1114]
MKNQIKTPQSNKPFIYFILSTLFLFTIASCSSDDDTTEPPVNNDNIINISQFQTDAQGWRITGDAQGGYVEASYSPDGGVNDGYIYADDDVAGGVWYFTAPDLYHGNKSVYYNATLSFSLFQTSAMDNQFENADIIFRNGSDQITYVHALTDYPTSEWTDYSLKISTESGWLKGDFDSGTPATEAEIKAILSNVTEFSIRGEFQSGPDTGGMDNIKISLE